MFPSSVLFGLFQWLTTSIVLFAIIIWVRNKTRKHLQDGSIKRRKLIAVIGSGGHTTEMLNLLSALDDLFTERRYVVAGSDKLSVAKIEEFERKHGNKFKILTVPRPREVGQNLLCSFRSIVIALIHSVILVYQERADVVLSNGPAIGFGICLVARFFDLLRLNRCRIVFVESICRVQKLSLTGWLLYNFRISHVFIVQWSDLQNKYPRSEYIGRLV